jgi:hypothetical protein
MMALTKLPDEASFIAVDPKTGDLVGVWSNAHNAMRYTAGGDDVGQIPAEGQFDGWPGQVRFDHAGNLYVRANNTAECYVAGQKAWGVDHVGLYPFDNPPVFDVDADGSLWVGDSDTLYKVGPKGVGGKRVAIGPGWHLGQVTSPLGVRVDPHGNVYVIEGPARANAEVQRISVFDRDGKFVRVFGRGAKTPKADGEWPGQISNDALDLAFGPKGRVYVANWDGTAGPLLVFRPF